jgi:hypothetical protein
MFGLRNASFHAVLATSIVRWPGLRHDTPGPAICPFPRQAMELPRNSPMGFWAQNTAQPYAMTPPGADILDDGHMG